VTRIAFYHDAPDKLHTLARLLHKAVGQGHRLLIYVPDAALAAEVDRFLWTQPPTGFLPHCRADSPLAPETPILLAARTDDAAADAVLINLDAAVPPDFSRFPRLIEIIGQAEADKAPGRERFRFYRDHGHEIHRHNLGERN